VAGGYGGSVNEKPERREGLREVATARELLSAAQWMRDQDEPIDAQMWQTVYEIMRTAPSRRTRLMAARFFSERIDPEPRGAVIVNAPTTVAVTWQQPATPSTSPSPTPPESFNVSFTTDSGAGPASSATDDSAKA